MKVGCGQCCWVLQVLWTQSHKVWKTIYIWNPAIHITVTSQNPIGTRVSQNIKYLRKRWKQFQYFSSQAGRREGQRQLSMTKGWNISSANLCVRDSDGSGQIRGRKRSLGFPRCATLHLLNEGMGVRGGGPVSHVPGCSSQSVPSVLLCSAWGGRNSPRGQTLFLLSLRICVWSVQRADLLIN